MAHENRQPNTSQLSNSLIRDISAPAVYMGFLAAFTGYAASFTIVLAGLTAVGATESQAATGLFFATLGMAIGSIWLPSITRTPAAVAWSTPGSAFLASSLVLPGGFSEAVGGLIICALLLLLTGLIPALGRVVSAIPKPIANALLAGVLLKLCLAPAIALGSIPWLVLPVLLAWLIGLLWHKLAAMPLAVIAFISVLFFMSDSAPMPLNENTTLLPELALITPIFTLQACISIAIPLYLVTMAGQNIPGFAVLELNNYTINRQFLLRGTGLLSTVIAAFGSVPVNMSAITAAMMSGEDAGKNPARRYWAAIASGVALIGLSFAAGTVAMLTAIAPSALITAIAGLALVPALVASLSAAFSNQAQLEAPAFTFLIVTSGMTLLGISGAFWGVVAGTLIWFAKRLRRSPP